MNKSFALIGTTLMLGIASHTLAGTAVTYNWDGGASGDWDVASNWDQDAVPNSVNHKVVIDGADVTLDISVTVGELVITDDAYLNIASGGDLDINRGASSPSQNGLLTIEKSSVSDFGQIDVQAGGTLEFSYNDSATTPHAVGGKIFLVGSTSDMFITDQSATFGPYSSFKGSLIGQDNAAQLAIAGDLTMSFGIQLMGQMLVTDGGGGSSNPLFELTSTGVALADVAGILSFGAGLDLDDASGSVWGATTSSSAVLRFRHTATSLVGLFMLDDDAKIELASAGVDITTSGNLKDSTGSGSPDGCVDADTGGDHDTIFTYSGGSVEDTTTCF